MVTDTTFSMSAGLSMNTALRSVVYIHGFNSSPQSHKAQLFRTWMAQTHPDTTVHIPALSPYPLDAMAQLKALASRAPAHTGFIGSSLGGFYAVHLAETCRAPAVLINPAVRPFDTLNRYLGENENFHTQERYVLTQQHVDDLRSLHVDKPSSPEKLLLMVQTGDETLDFHEATAQFRASPSVIEYGGDHAFQHAEKHFPAMLRFLHAHCMA